MILSSRQIFKTEKEFTLQSGESLPEVEIAYQTWGELNSSRDNAILVCHSLTSDSGVANYFDENGNHVEGWWHEFVGVGKTIDIEKYFIICTNVLGSCYGSTGPTSINPNTGEQYRMNFPVVTVYDMVNSQRQLIEYLKIKKLHTVIGGSLGAMQALEWSVSFPEMVENLIAIATPAKHSAWAIGLNEIQRQAIMSDPDWQNGNYIDQPLKGLSQARQLAMISYRTKDSYDLKFGRDKIYTDIKFSITSKPHFQMENYLHYQGKKLVNRFDANSYLYLTKALDLFDLSENRDNVVDVLGSIKAKTLVIGIDSDILYPTDEQHFIQQNIPESVYAEVKSIHGHDGFLIETEQLNYIVKNFIN